MAEATIALLAAGMLVGAFLYASVGHGGASAYLAVMALAGFAPQQMRPVALLLNVLVSLIATFKFYRAGHFRWALFWPFAVTSIPCAFLGGALVLPGHAYQILVGLVLLYTGWKLWLSGQAGAVVRPEREIQVGLAIAFGAGIGLLSGLTGVGGGIFLSPVLLLLGWAAPRQTSAVTAPFILVNSIAALAAGLSTEATVPSFVWILAAAVVVGGYAGAEYGSTRSTNPVSRRLLALVLAVAGGKMLLVWHGSR